MSDFDYSFNAVQTFINQNNLSLYGEGVLSTTAYPNPFPVVLSSTSLIGSCGNGIAYDSSGQQIQVTDGLGSFTISAASTTNPRADLLVLRYLPVGDTQIPSPSQPTTQVYLNIHDGYQFAVIAGTPAASPVYPTKGQYDVILGGLQVATSGSVTLDLSIREIATPVRSFFPTFKQENLTSPYTLSAIPLNAASLLVSINGIVQPSSAYTLSGQVITFNVNPSPAQDVAAYYVVNSTGSVNPVAGFQETPTGTVDGTNQTFVLTQEPVDQNSTQVYVDGVVTPITGWSLVQSQSLNKIVFNAGFIPQPGQDVYAFYLRNAVSMATSTSSSSSSSGTTHQSTTEYPALQAADITNGYVTLSHVPINPTLVLLDVVGGSSQAYGSDFTVVGAILTWSSVLQSEFAVGDVLRVHYQY